ncbi:hypothetical protein L596_008535 [Steinernema carpocapsae]|uniref:Uncharacterized protein n=1 Tax=Steinernema carpocapsae TaxID=34508 RepID=A0A4U5PDA8_STECR|nr:hypothetical protein L596_008535 [Steinernema carpocapsae]
MANSTRSFKNSSKRRKLVEIHLAFSVYPERQSKQSFLALFTPKSAKIQVHTAFSGLENPVFSRYAKRPVIPRHGFFQLPNNSVFTKTPLHSQTKYQLF